MKIDFSLILPCYNEAEHFEASVKKITEYLAFYFPPESYEIIFVDDGSKDETRDLLRRLRTNEHLKIVLNAKNLGRGGAVKRGMEIARGEIVGFMDIDCEVSEAYLTKFIQVMKTEQADLTIANRFYNVKLSFRAIFRYVLSAGYRMLISRLVGVPGIDSEAGFKLFSRRAVRAILECSRFNDWFWDTEAVLICLQAKFDVKQIPVLFHRNLSKTSTVRPLRDSIQYLKAIRAFRKHQREGVYDKLLATPLPTKSHSPEKDLTARKPPGKRSAG